MRIDEKSQISTLGLLEWDLRFVLCFIYVEQLQLGTRHLKLAHISHYNATMEQVDGAFQYTSRAPVWCRCCLAISYSIIRLVQGLQYVDV